jgi:trimeric autotransporter adhesin
MKTPLLSFLLLRSKRILFLPAIICLTLLSLPGVAQTVTTGKSYVNISRPNGGTFVPGDIIEVRATIAITNVPAGTPVTQVRYNDTVNTAAFTYIPNTLQILSNEGRPQRTLPSLGAPFTDNSDPDSANIRASTFIRFNIGNGSGACDELAQGNGTTNAGSLWTLLRPRFFTTSCIRVYSFRVQIKNSPAVNYGMTILLNAGNFRYRLGGTNFVSNFSAYKITLAPDFGLCTNSIGSNAVVGESGGTFGSGTAQNRAAATTFVPPPYTKVNFSANAPNDNFFGIANRTSSDGTTNPNVNYSSGTGSGSRVFTVWDIIGDHTGAANPLVGNAPTNTGYALVINASYETNLAFTQNITGLCEETYYEFSAWFRNICRRCGCDSTGKGSTTSGYVPGPITMSAGPTPVPDSSGVRPNLSFQIDGEDFYTSGNIPYTGKWVKKGFVFKTKAGQTSMRVTIRNNAPGGGGNDWAIDDIGVANCLPNMKYNPSITPNVCVGNPLKLVDTVRSFFNNYTHQQWQTSTDGGLTWTNLGIARDSVPFFNAALNVWEYWSRYTTPVATLGDNGRKFRLVVATSTTNLTDDNCRSTDPMNNVTVNVIDCGPVLDTKLISFNGKISNAKATLQWTTTGEKEPMLFDVERSVDGSNFSVVKTVSSSNTNPSELNHYSFTDPDDIAGIVHYRINMRTIDNKAAYSRILQLSGKADNFAFGAVINPFNHVLFFDISTAKAGVAKAELVDQLGNAIRRKSFEIREGMNSLAFDNTSVLPNGIYVLRVEMAGMVVYKKVMKTM